MKPASDFYQQEPNNKINGLSKKYKTDNKTETLTKSLIISGVETL